MQPSDYSLHKLPEKSPVRFVTIDANHAGQRIDNFLLRELKNVPRSYVYRILRKGEVRVNKKRIKPLFKLSSGDVVRIPPVHLAENRNTGLAPQSLLTQIKDAIIEEDDDLIFIDKPSGLAVHGGSGVRYGLIESFRQLRPELAFVELVHRLDKETSGIVMLAKNRQTLLALHELLKTGGIQKYYQTLAKGQWQGGRREIINQLERQQGRQQKVQVVKTDYKNQGKEAHSIFSPLTPLADCTLLKVELLTGRMHQIRTQLADLGHPVLGDSQYGDFSLNRDYKKQYGLKRLFLHAYHVTFLLPTTGKQYDCEIPLADDLLQVVEALT